MRPSPGSEGHLPPLRPALQQRLAAAPVRPGGLAHPAPRIPEQAAPPADAGHHVRTGIGQRGLIDSARLRQGGLLAVQASQEHLHFLARLLVALAAGHARRAAMPHGPPVAGHWPARLLPSSFRLPSNADQAPRSGPGGLPRVPGCRHPASPCPGRSAAARRPACGKHAFQSFDVHPRTSTSSSAGPGWKRPRWNSSGVPPFSCTSMMRPASSR